MHDLYHTEQDAAQGHYREERQGTLLGHAAKTTNHGHQTRNDEEDAATADNPRGCFARKGYQQTAENQENKGAEQGAF